MTALETYVADKERNENVQKVRSKIITGYAKKNLLGK